MSKVSTIYDNLGALVAATVPAYKRIPNPYVAAANSQLLLAKAYGIGIGDGRAEDLSLGNQRGRSRTFSLVLINLVSSLDNDTGGRETLEKQLLEDFLAIESALELDNTLGGYALKVDYVSDSGIDFLAADGGKFKYIAITVQFLVLYEETIL